jgi:hypothetical protein
MVGGCVFVNALVDMADIGIPKPLHPAWPTRAIKPAGNSNDRKSPSRGKPSNQKNKNDDDPDNPQHIDEYA